MRIIIRIGGSVIANPINTELISKYADIIKTLKTKDHKIVVILGGGSLAREFIGLAKKLALDATAQDEVAISCSRLFAQLFLKKLGDIACDKVAVTLEEAEKCLNKDKVIVMGGLKPGITTDTVATLVAEQIKADLLVKGTDQDGVYDKDPRKHLDAVKLDHLTIEELNSVFEQNEHKAGIHQILDPEAVKVLNRHRIKTIIFNGYKPENMLAAIEGQNIGTTIS